MWNAPAVITATRWQSVSEWPLTLAAIALLAAYGWQVLGDLRGQEADVAKFGDHVDLVKFAADYAFRLVSRRTEVDGFLSGVCWTSPSSRNPISSARIRQASPTT